MGKGAKSGANHHPAVSGSKSGQLTVAQDEKTATEDGHTGERPSGGFVHKPLAMSSEKMVAAAQAKANMHKINKKDIQKWVKALNLKFSKKSGVEYVSPDEFCQEFFVALGVGEKGKYKLENFYDISHEFLGMLAEVMKLTMEKMFKQTKANAAENEVESAIINKKKYMFIDKVLHDDIMSSINLINWGYTIRKSDYSFSKPLDDLDCMRIQLLKK